VRQKQVINMNCWHCKSELIWGGDHDLEDESDAFSMVTNLSCSSCGCYVEVYIPKEDGEE